MENTTKGKFKTRNVLPTLISIKLNHMPNYLGICISHLHIYYFSVNIYIADQ